MMDRRTSGALVAAVLAAIALGYVNLHNDEVQAPLAILLLSTFLLGLGEPRRAWRWALIVALAVPISSLLALQIGVFYPCRPGHPYSCDGPGSLGTAVSTVVLLLPALISTYAGVLARRSMRPLREA